MRRLFTYKKNLRYSSYLHYKYCPLMVNMDALLTDNTTVWSKMSRWVLILKNSQLKKSSHTTWILLLHLAIISYLHISKVISSSIFLTSFPSYMGQYMKKLPSLTYSHNNRFYLFIFFFYLGFVSPCNIIHSNKSNQHVSGMPKTCWAVFKWWAINLRDWCIWLVDLFKWRMSHIKNCWGRWICNRQYL